MPKNALYSVKDLPARWTSGGKKNKKLREKGRIVVTFYGNYKSRHREAVEGLMQKLEER